VTRAAVAHPLSERELLAARTGLVVSPPSKLAGLSATSRGHAVSEIVFGPGGEYPIGSDLQDAERLLDQGRCDAAPAHRSDNTARGLPLASNAQSNDVFGTTKWRQSRQQTHAQSQAKAAAFLR